MAAPACSNLALTEERVKSLHGQFHHAAISQFRTCNSKSFTMSSSVA